MSSNATLGSILRHSISKNLKRDRALICIFLADFISLKFLFINFRNFFTFLIVFFFSKSVIIFKNQLGFHRQIPLVSISFYIFSHVFSCTPSLFDTALIQIGKRLLHLRICKHYKKDIYSQNIILLSLFPDWFRYCICSSLASNRCWAN